MTGIPRGSEIVMALDAGGFRFPTPPDFDDGDVDVHCYRLIHHAWREGLLTDFLRLLQVWRNGDRLCRAASRPEFQTALLEFLRENRRAALCDLIDCLAQQPQRIAAGNDLASTDVARRRLDALWRDYSARHAA